MSGYYLRVHCFTIQQKGSHWREEGGENAASSTNPRSTPPMLRTAHSDVQGVHAPACVVDVTRVYNDKVWVLLLEFGTHEVDTCQVLTTLHFSSPMFLQVESRAMFQLHDLRKPALFRLTLIKLVLRRAQNDSLSSSQKLSWTHPKIPSTEFP